MNEEHKVPTYSPAPLPMGVNLDILKSVDGRSWVKIEVAHPAGVFVAFFDPEGAAQLGADLSAIAQQARTSGIVVPGMNGDLRNIRSDDA